jgi:hypothetical protein
VDFRFVKVVDFAWGDQAKLLIRRARRRVHRVFNFGLVFTGPDSLSWTSSERKGVQVFRIRKPDQFFHEIKYWAVHIAATVVFLTWLAKAVWHELRL